MLSKLPVVQHVLFGSILQCTWSESALNTNHNNNNTNNADNKSNSTSTQLSSVTVFNTNNMIDNNNSNNDNSNTSSNSNSNISSKSIIENNNDRKIGSKPESTETREDNKLLSLSAQALTSLDDDL